MLAPTIVFLQPARGSGRWAVALLVLAVMRAQAAEPLCLENDALRLRFDSQTGAVWPT